jgi:predicted Zn-ribbon and HTH transcriptional regulator
MAPIRAQYEWDRCHKCGHAFKVEFGARGQVRCPKCNAPGVELEQEEVK